MKIFLNAYNNGSKSALALKEGLGIPMIKSANSKFTGHKDTVVINWGASEASEEVMKCRVINNPDAVKLVTNKLNFFTHVKDFVNVPEFTTDKDVAKKWLDKSKVVFVREKLNAHSGEGIVILDSEGSWENYNHDLAKMYVEYIPKKEEYRLHFLFGEIIDVQQKIRNPDVDLKYINFKIRSHNNGFIFARNGISPNEEVKKQAYLAMEKSGLQFGAVDVIWNNYRNKAYVLEINTAPGLEGTTIEHYKKAFSRLFEENTFDTKPMDHLLKEIGKINKGLKEHVQYGIGGIPGHHKLPNPVNGLFEGEEILDEPDF